ncbi:MAG TPA: DUF3592 domain-containing protein [Chthoniobacterales bacterium]
MLSLIFLIVFPFALWKAWKNIQMAKASTGWPTVSGTVTTAKRARVMFRKQPRVTYSYSVNGAPFTGQRISFAGGYPPRETDAILSRYPVGQEVVVWHAPDKPAEATLETGSNRQVTSQLRILLIFFVLIILLNILNFYLKRLDEQKKPPIRTYGAAEVHDRKWGDRAAGRRKTLIYFAAPYVESRTCLRIAVKIFRIPIWLPVFLMKAGIIPPLSV